MSNEQAERFDQQQPVADIYNVADELLLPGGRGRFKDHRKSYGLEFIDIRREINAEMKRVGGRKSPRGTTGNKQPRKAAKENLRGANLRCTGGVDRTQDSADTSILTGGKNLRGSRS